MGIPEQIKPGDFHTVFAAPPCTEYSVAKTTGPPRDYELADSIVTRTLEIMEYLKPASGGWGILDRVT